MPLQHPVQHQHGQEGLRPLVQQGDVLGAQVLPAPQPVLGRRAAVVHPGLGELQRRAADVQDEGDPRFGEPRPQGIEIHMAGRAPAAGPVRQPGGAQPRLQRKLKLGDGQIRLVQRHHRDADQARIGAAEVGHVAIVRPRRAIAKGRLELRARRERHGDAVGRENELLLEAQHVEGGDTVGAVEGAQGLDFLRRGDQLVPQRDLRRHVFGAVPPALPHDDGHLLVGDDGGGVADLRYVVAQGGVGVFLQEVRQLHDVAVGVIDGAAARRVGHGVSPLRTPERLRGAPVILRSIPKARRQRQRLVRAPL